MKKIINLLIKFVVIIIVLYGVMIINDIFRSANNQGLLLMIQANIYDYTDGVIHEYIGMGYKVIKYDFVDEKRTIIIPFWVKSEIR